MDIMPNVPVAVSLSDILEVRGGPLREREVWALLCQSAAAIQDFFIKGASSKKDDPPFVISPLTLTVCRDGQVSLTPGENTWHGTCFMAPECCSDTAHLLSDTAIEKMFLYTLGKTLQVATEYGLCKNEYVCVSHHLDSLLEAMCEENPAVRIGLRSILEACDLHTRQHPEKSPYAHTICHLYSTVLGSTASQAGMDSSYSSDNSMQRAVRSRRRPHLLQHHPRHHPHDRHSSPSSSPPPPPNHSRSRSRSRSRSPGKENSDLSSTYVKPTDEDESEKTGSNSCISVCNSSSLPAFAATSGILTSLTTTSSSAVPPLASSQDLNASFASSLGDRASLYQSAPAYPAYPGLVSLHMENPAYGKYLQLKERRHRLKVAKTGKQAVDMERMSFDGLSTAHSVPVPFGPWHGDMMDYMTDARSLASLMSYNVGSCMPELASVDTLSPVPAAHGGSALSSNLSLLMQDDQQIHDNLPEEQRESPVEASSTCLKRRHEDDTPEEYQKRQSHPTPKEMPKSHQNQDKSSPLLQQIQVEQSDKLAVEPSVETFHPSEELLAKESSTPHLPLKIGQQQQQPPVQHLHQFGSRDWTPTPEALPVKEYYGPEFVYRASHPVIRMSLPLQGESVKTPSLARRVMIVHLTGQRFEGLVDPCMTGRQLFDAVVTHTTLDDFYFFGLTYICDGEYFFLDADTKLHKMSPEGWREGAKGHMPPVTFTLYLRVKFYPDSLADLRHASSQHLLYLQLRRDLLEERCLTDDQQLLALSGLALHAEFGDYSRRTMGHNYFVPEQYLPARAAHRLGMAYVHDRALQAHRDALGLAPSQCEIQFVKMVQKLPEYGIHFYKLMKAKNDTSNLVWVGLTQSSLLIAEQGAAQRSVTQALPWTAILKISFNKRRFSVQPKGDRAAHAKAKQPKISFFTNSYRKGKYLLQLSTAQHRFCIRMRSRAAALGTLGGQGSMDDGQYSVRTFGQQPAMVDGVKEGEEDKEVEEDREDEDEAQCMFSQEMAASVDSGNEPAGESASAHSPPKMSSPGTESRSSVGVEEDRPDMPPLKYRSPPAYHPNTECFLEELSADSSVPAQDAVPTMAASSDMHASVSSVLDTGTGLADGHSDVGNQIADHSLSPQLSDHLLAESPPHPDHHADHVHPPIAEGHASHLASGQPPVGRQMVEVTVQKEGEKGIGLTIVGGETTGSLDLGIFVKSVMKDGPAARTGRVRAGDRLIAINGVSLEGVQHHQAVQLIRDSAASVRLLLSQMQAPLTVRRKLEDPESRLDSDDIHRVDLPDDDDVFLGRPDIDASMNSAVVSPPHHSHSLSVPHDYRGSSDFRTSGSIEPLTNSVSELDTDSVGGESGDELLLSEEMLAAAELHAQDYDSEDASHTLDAERELDRETQELQILGDIANMTVDNSDTDSDFESAVQATVEGRTSRKSAEIVSKPFRKSVSVSSADCVIYEVVLEKELGSLGIVTSEGAPGSKLYVESLVPGGPAQAGGILQPGDCLLEFNGQPLRGVTKRELQKAVHTAPDVCLLKVARTKSLDAHAQAPPPEQVVKGHGSSQQRAPAVAGETSQEDTTGQDSQISPPSAFASAAVVPRKDSSSLLVAPPPPQPMFGVRHEAEDEPSYNTQSDVDSDVPRKDRSSLPVAPPPPQPIFGVHHEAEDEPSYNTQSDVDSDVLDSSRSELDRMYRSAERYLDHDLAEMELDAVVGVASLNMVAEDGVRSAAAEDRNVHTDSQTGAAGVSRDLSPASETVEKLSLASETVENLSPPTLCSVDSVLPVTTKPSSKSLVRQEHVADSSERDSDSAAGEPVANENKAEEFVVDLVKGAMGGLGFTVVGGASTTGGCYIKAVLQDPALSDGRLRPGDTLIQVNGQDMTGLSHFEAVTLLRQTPKEVSIKLRRHKDTAQPFNPPPHTTGKDGLPDKPQQAMGVLRQQEHPARLSRHAEPDENSSESVGDPRQASPEHQEVQARPVKDQARVDTPRAVIRPYTHGQQNSAAQDRARAQGPESSQPNSYTTTDVVQVTLNKSQPRESLGFSLVQRRRDSGQSGIFVKTLTSGGIAHTDGQLRVGDRLIQVNGEALIGCSHTKAVRLLREAVGTVVLTISRFPEDQPDSNVTEVGAPSAGDPGRRTSQEGGDSPSTSTHSSNQLSDDDINDILDEAISFLDRQEQKDSRSEEAGGEHQHLPVLGDAGTSGWEEHVLPAGSVHPASHSPNATQSHEDQERAEVSVRHMSSVHLPEDLTVRRLLSLPVLRVTQEVEEKSMQLLQSLADALEQEEPLLEFEKLRQMKATDNMETAKLPENKSRNRYRNVLPYDYNRVKLRTTLPEENDYINASDVQLGVKGREEGALRYIACQGPLDCTQDHFWRMVWECRANVVAMLTQGVELGKAKCHTYWPQAVGTTLDLGEGSYTVELVKEEQLEDFAMRRLRLTHCGCGQDREVVQLHYTAWPDHGVPNSAYPLLLFLRLMHQAHRRGPCVVHCSAGIGRSGVLMAVDTALARMEAGDELDLFDIVSELRHQRYGMIQTQEQYLFCYTACMEALLSVER